LGLMVQGLDFMVHDVLLRVQVSGCWTVKERAKAEASHEAFACGESATLLCGSEFWVKDLGIGSRG